MFLEIGVQYIWTFKSQTRGTRSGKDVCFFVSKNEWKLNLFYNGIKIKTLKISKNEAPADNVYFIKVLGKKNLFGSNYVELAVRPKVLLGTNEKEKQTYWGVVFEKGVNIE